jgi:hypothetical protein
MSKTIRKWIWIPVSGAVAGLVLPFVAVQLVLPYMLRHTEAYEIATRYIVSDPLIRKTVGSPARVDMRRGRFYMRADRPVAEFLVTVEGPSKTGSVSITIIKQRGVWDISGAEFTRPDGALVKLR